jgi:hypothetical protein
MILRPSFSVLAAACLYCSLAAAGDVPVRTVLDLTDAFKPALVQGSRDVQAVERGVSGGVARRGIFAHPPGTGDTIVPFTVDLPPVRAGARLLLTFYLGIRDGIGREGFDGVGFRVDVEGQHVFSEDWRETRWACRACDLSTWAGKKVRIELRTNCLARSNYDWAVWGEPRILALEGRLGPNQQAAAGVAVWPADAGKFGLAEFAEAKYAEVAALQQKIGAAQGVPEGQQAAIEVYPYLPELRIIQAGLNQAIVAPGQAPILEATVKNIGRAPVAEGDWPTVTAAGQSLDVASPSRRLAAIAPSESQRLWWELAPINKPGKYEATVTLTGGEAARCAFEVVPAAAPTAIDDGRIRVELRTPTPQVAQARFAVREAGGWRIAAVDPRCAELVLGAGEAVPLPWTLAKPEAKGAVALRAAFDRQGHRGRVEVRYEIASTPGWVDITSTLTAQTPLAVGRFGGPAILADEPGVLEGEAYAARRRQHLAQLSGAPDRSADMPRSFHVGDGGEKPVRNFALLPGLEYLAGDERSSSNRDADYPLAMRYVPHPLKITMPLMAVVRGGTLVSLHWDPMQKWDGQHAFPAAQFCSPNWINGQDNHLMGLFLPAVPDWTAENATVAAKPYVLEAGKSLVVKASLLVLTRDSLLSPRDTDTSPREPTQVVERVRESVRATPVPLDPIDACRAHLARFGAAVPETPPRSVADEIALCREGFLKTVWDPATERSLHCIGWAPANAPGFATLLWQDSLVTATADAKARAELIVRNTLRDGGPGGLISVANCHILRWEAPFYFGHLAPSMAAAESQARGLIGGQEPDGAWLWHPGPASKTLGRPGDRLLGPCAGPAYNLWRYVRLTGDPEVEAAARKATDALKRFQVPRGAQGWECPMYEPDILAAAYALGAAIEAFRATGEEQYLDMARYWAGTGIPFLYHWHDPQRPGMLYATIPVFGTTFYTHSWFGVPVQWCGLVYAYHLGHLADIEDSRVPGSGALWRQLVRGVTHSAMHQQWTDPEKRGTYPDGFYEFCTAGRAPHINPEDILINLLALEGHDPDMKTRQVKVDSRPVRITSGTPLGEATAEGRRITFRLDGRAGLTSHVLVAGLRGKPVVRRGQAALAEVADPDAVDEGFAFLPAKGFVVLKVRHAADRETVVIEIP